MTEPFKYAHDDPRVEQLARYMFDLVEGVGISPDAPMFHGAAYRMGARDAFIAPETQPAWKAYDPLARMALLWFEKQGGSLPETPKP